MREKTSLVGLLESDRNPRTYQGSNSLAGDEPGGQAPSSGLSRRQAIRGGATMLAVSAAALANATPISRAMVEQVGGASLVPAAEADAELFALVEELKQAEQRYAALEQKWQPLFDEADKAERALIPNPKVGPLAWEDADLRRQAHDSVPGYYDACYALEDATTDVCEIRAEILETKTTTLRGHQIRTRIVLDLLEDESADENLDTYDRATRSLLRVLLALEPAPTGGYALRQAA
jgi:hypothetical protein